MGTLTMKKANHLFWLGRYTERVYTTISYMMEVGDRAIDGEEVDYQALCRNLVIPDIYTGVEDFCTRFLFDKENPDSVTSNMYHAYDNAIVLRETLSSKALSYIFMALSAMEGAATSISPAVEMQWVVDDILAFRGCAADYIDDDDCRRVMQCGSSVERIDLYLRLNYNTGLVRKEIGKLVNRMYKTPVAHDTQRLQKLADSLMLEDHQLPAKADVLDWVDNAFQI